MTSDELLHELSAANKRIAQLERTIKFIGALTEWFMRSPSFHLQRLAQREIRLEIEKING